MSSNTFLFDHSFTYQIVRNGNAVENKFYFFFSQVLWKNVSKITFRSLCCSVFVVLFFLLQCWFCYFETIFVSPGVTFHSKECGSAAHIRGIIAALWFLWSPMLSGCENHAFRGTETSWQSLEVRKSAFWSIGRKSDGKCSYLCTMHMQFYGKIYPVFGLFLIAK